MPEDDGAAAGVGGCHDADDGGCALCELQ
jgi:hypothetical protein